MTVDTLSLAGKSALITGSGRENGIGAAIARALARNGAAVALHYMSEESKPRAEKVAADLIKQYGANVTVVHGSVSDYKTTREMISHALEGLGVDHIDILGMFQRLNSQLTACFAGLKSERH
jgi:NAD(P)-dependent dehydrogenase (short-subunit alcohol dehydrogenase family)